MKKKIISILLTAIMGLMITVMVSKNASAVENQNGGQVVTEGVITFYEESKESTVESSEKTKIVKPVGKFPSTGEIVKGTVGLSGITIIVIVLFLFFKKRKKEEEKK